MRFLDRIKYSLAMLRKGPQYQMTMFTTMNKRFWNNGEKIIGWTDGYPVVSLLSPPSFHPAQAYAMTTKIQTLFQGRSLPDMANISVTDKCPADCEYCSFTSVRQDKPLLSTSQLKQAIQDVQELGVATLNITGGEPLMHPDIIDVIDSIDKSRAYVTLFSTGYQLESKAKQLKKAGLTTVMVSIESAQASIHDARKSYPGSFERAVKGIKAALKQKLIVAISKVVYKEDMKNNAEKLKQLFELAKSLKVNAVLLFDAIPTGSLYSKEESALGMELQNEIIRLSTEYNKKSGYPGVLSYTHLKNPWRVGCSGGRSYFYMTPYGDIQPCDFMPMSAGNITEEPLPLIWDKFSREPEFQKSGLQGCRMQLREFREKYKENLESRTFPVK